MSVLGDKIKVADIGSNRRSHEMDIGGETITIYSLPLTGKDIDRITAAHKDFADNPKIAAIVDIIIMKAENEDGTKAFDKMDKSVLVRQPVSWIHAVKDALFSDDEDMTEDRIEEDEKN